MLRALLLYLARRKRFQHWIMGHPFSRRAALRFVAGDTLDDAFAAVRGLNAVGIRATLDHLGENVSDPASAVRSAQAYVAALRGIARSGVDSNVSLKLTHMGLDLSHDLCRDNLRTVLDEAARLGNFVRIDMEGSAYTQATLDLYRELRDLGYSNVGVVIQAYLYRSLADVEDLAARGARVRLCKGAYDEPSRVAFTRRRDLARNFRRLAEVLLERGNYPAIATHDESLIAWTKEHTRRLGIGKERFEFQLLYGIRRDLQEQLAREGFNVRVYVPYGDEWYPYLMRRMAERPDNFLFVLRHLFRR